MSVKLGRVDDFFKFTRLFALFKSSELALAVRFWIFGTIFVFIIGFLLDFNYFDIMTPKLVEFLVPLVVSGACVFFLSFYAFKKSRWVLFGLFFSISLTSLLGFSETLTGSHAAASNPFLYGLSFYSASLAYLYWVGGLNKEVAFNVSNPLLLFTGPVALFVRSINGKGFRSRFRYYYPFIVLGVFLHQVVATPLTDTFFLIEKTDLVSTFTFAIIFELFVYSNFCGLSLMIYGVAGIMGFKIPLNFKQPFSATNLVDFWRGWHTSLSAVLKEIFYTPTKKAFGSTMALFMVYLASAMWHGITINFLAWGVFHALMFVVTLWLLRRKFVVLPIVVFVLAVIYGRILFSDSDTDRLLDKLFSFEFLGFDAFTSILSLSKVTLLALGLALIFVFVEFSCQKFPMFRKRNYKFYRVPVVQFMMMALIMVFVDANIGVDYAVYGQR